MQTTTYVWQREIPSHSTPGKTYTVSETAADEWQCDCMAWTRRRLECSHIKEGKALQAAEKKIKKKESMSEGTGYRKRMGFLSRYITDDSTEYATLFIGCYSGFEPLFFSEDHPHCFAVGVDVNRKYFDKTISNRVSFVACDGAYLPFIDKAFSWEYCAHVLEHIPKDKRMTFLSEMRRTVRTGIIVACPNAQRVVSYFDSAIKEPLVNIVKMNFLDWMYRGLGTFERHHRGFTRTELTTMLSLLFNDVKCVTTEYDFYMSRGSRYDLILKLLNAIGMLDIFTPSHTLVARPMLQIGS